MRIHMLKIPNDHPQSIAKSCCLSPKKHSKIAPAGIYDQEITEINLQNMNDLEGNLKNKSKHGGN